MKVKKSVFDFIKKSAVSSLILNLAVLAFALKFCHMVFGTNDDRDISNLLANVYGNGKGYYIIFINVILTKCLSVLYEITGNFTNWYVVISLGLSFISLCSICALLIKRASNYYVGLLMAFIALSWSYRYHYVTLQFTQNAALYATVGMLFLADAFLFGDEKFLRTRCAYGVLMFAIGSLFRFQCLYFVIPFLALLIVLDFAGSKKKLGWFKEKRACLISVCLAFALVIGAKAFHNHVFDSDPELSAYREENSLRVELADYGFPDYAEHEKEYKDLGIEYEDYYLFSHQFYVDRSKLSIDVMRSIVDMKPVKGSQYSLKNILHANKLPFAKYFVKSCRKNTLLIIFLLYVFFLLFTTRKRWGFLFGSCLLCNLIMSYFVSVDRMPVRIWYSLTLPFIMIVFYVCSACFIPAYKKELDKILEVRASVSATSHNKLLSKVLDKTNALLARFSMYNTFKSRCRRHPVLLVMMLVLLVLGVRSTRQTVMDNRAEDKVTAAYEAILSLAKYYPDSLILLDRTTVSFEECASTITPLTCLPEGSQSNMCILGGWICWSPDNMSVLSRNDAENPFEALSKGKDVYLVDRAITSSYNYADEVVSFVLPELKLAYIRRHYGSDIQMDKVAALRGSKISIYHLYAAPSETASENVAG